jgi:hypothetical protein
MTAEKRQMADFARYQNPPFDFPLSSGYALGLPKLHQYKQ